MDKIIEIKNLDVYYGEKKALSAINLEIPKRKITAIIGPSGCGKSTLLQAVNGILKGNRDVKISGQILLDGRDSKQIPDGELRRRIGLVFQTPSPFPFSVYKNMTYALKYYGKKGKQELLEITKEKLVMAGLYDEVKDDLMKNALKLSGGQQQRLCIARALTVEPEVLLLDEPCSALDVKSSGLIEELLLKLKENYTIVLVTHNIAQAKRVADYVVYLEDGVLLESGEKEAFFENTKTKEAKSFLFADRI